MKIAILGWGSLLWDSRPEFDQWHEPWQYDGPTLTLEFSRVSKSRLNALTLVIDKVNGAPTCVTWCLSKRTNPDDAVCDLRCREGTTLRNIGRIDVARKANPRDHASVQDAIARWACEKRVDVVVWTALESNLQQETGQHFSLSAALGHLRSLTPEGKAMAAEYVRRTPPFVRTPLRAAVEGEPWFSQTSS